MQVYRKRITERLNKVSPKHDQHSTDSLYYNNNYEPTVAEAKQQLMLRISIYTNSWL